MTSELRSDPRLQELVSAALEARDRGEELDLVGLCGDRPDLVEAVSEALQLAQRLPKLHALEPAQDHLSGAVLENRYVLEDRLGAGSMGVVYRAFDRELRRRVAVKILRSLVLEGKESEHRFQREAETLAAVRHESIVMVLDRGRTRDGYPFLVMELLDGASLSDLMECVRDCDENTAEGYDAQNLAAIALRLGRAAMDEHNYLRLVVRWSAQIAAGLEAAHERSIYHRDVKPSNIFIRDDGQPVLFDFGIAADTSQATLTRDGTALGTPAYMAPEALSSRVAPGPALDVYGLTATLYHLLTFKAPYSGNPSQILTALAVKDPVRAERIRPSLPRDLQAILDRGMARRPSDRYPSAGALARDLSAFLEHRPVEARPLSLATRLWRRVRASKAFRGAASVALIVLAVLTTVGWRSHVQESRERSFREAWSHIPGNFTLGNPEFRRAEDETIRAELELLLDRAVRYASHPIPANLVRAAFRLDQGDPGGAAEDMRRVASSVRSDYASALARAYASLPASAAGAAALELSELPAPRSTLDHYLAAFHARRADHRADVRSHLGLPGQSEHAPSLELGLAYVVGQPGSTALEVIARIEHLNAGRSAATAHWLGTHLFYDREYERALDVLQEGIALNSRAHALQVYAGWCCLRLERLEEAIAFFESAKDIRPRSTGAFELQARALIDQGEFEVARAVVTSAPYGEGARAQGQRAKLLGELEAELALAMLRAQRLDDAELAASESIAYFEEARGFGANVELPRAAIANAIFDGDHRRIFGSIIELLEERGSLSGRWAEVLLDWMPADLDAVETAAVRSLFETLAH